MISFEDFILEDDASIYLQIIRYVKRGIVAGSIGNGEEMISRRALSALLGVNPNTIQKAYHLLEEEGIIRSRSGAKSCVEADEVRKEKIRRELLTQDTGAWVQAMKQMKVEKEQALALAADLWGNPPNRRGLRWIPLEDSAGGESLLEGQPGLPEAGKEWSGQPELPEAGKEWNGQPGLPGAGKEREAYAGN